MKTEFTVAADEAGMTLAAVLRRHVPELAWSRAKRMCERGQGAARRRAAGRRHGAAARAPDGRRSTRRAPAPLAGRARRSCSTTRTWWSSTSRPASPACRTRSARRGTAMDLVRGAWRRRRRKRADRRRPAARRASHRQGHLGPARVRQDQARRARAADAVPRARHRAHVPVRRARHAHRSAHRDAASSPIAATGCAARRASPTRASARSRTCACVEDAARARRCARCGSRPARPTRSASTWPRRGHPLVGETRLHPRLHRGGQRADRRRRASCCTRPRSASCIR